MATVAAISPVLIFLLLIQSTCAQFNLAYLQNSANQQLQPNANTLNPIPSARVNFNEPQCSSVQKINSQPQSNIQQNLPPMAGNTQPQLNVLQPPCKMGCQSQLFEQQNQNLASSVLSALQNIQPQNQGVHVGKVSLKPCSSCNFGNSVEQSFIQPQSQTSPTIVSNPLMNKSQISQVSPLLSSFVDKMQPFTIQSVPSTDNQNTAALQGSQFPQVLYISSSPYEQRAANVQSAPVQTQTTQSQPIVLTLTPFQNQQTPSNGQKQQTLYSVQLPPPAQNQLHNLNKASPISDDVPMDNQSLLSYAMSQLQSQGNSNALASMLPAMLNTKSEKSSNSIKSLLPFLLNLFNERNGCGCPHCGCRNACQNSQEVSQPTINTGYSSQKNYGQKDLPNVPLKKFTEMADTDAVNAQQRNIVQHDVIENSSDELSEEEEDEEDENVIDE